MSDDLSISLLKTLRSLVSVFIGPLLGWLAGFVLLFVGTQVITYLAPPFKEPFQLAFTFMPFSLFFGYPLSVVLAILGLTISYYLEVSVFWCGIVLGLITSTIFIIFFLPHNFGIAIWSYYLGLCYSLGVVGTFRGFAFISGGKMDDDF